MENESFLQKLNIQLEGISDEYIRQARAFRQFDLPFVLTIE